MKPILYLFFSLLILTSFTTDKKFTLETKPNETILFGRLNIYNDGDIKVKDIFFQMRNIEKGSSYKVRLDPEGYFILKVPAGNYEIKRVWYKEYFINLPHGYLTLEACDPDNLYYTGNIYINWSPVHYDRKTSPYFMVSTSSYYGLVGAVATLAIASISSTVEQKNVDIIPAIVRKKPETTDRFYMHYPDCQKEIKYSPVNIQVYN